MIRNAHATFAILSKQGLRHEILPMRLYHKAKRLGIWDPRSIDFSQDIFDWQQCTEGERKRLISLTALFQAGEESVTFDLLPLMLAIAQEGRLEEELFLATFLWEEAKHTEFFRRFLEEVAEHHEDLSRYHSKSYRRLFYEEVPRSMYALLTDRSPATQVNAAVTYHLMAEGILAQIGYQSYFNLLDRANIMPGLKQGIGYLKRDEARHVAYGMFLISRLLAVDPTLWDVVESRMQALLPVVLEIVRERCDPAFIGMPSFNFKMDYAMNLFQKRMVRLKRATSQTLEQIYQTSESLGEIEDMEGQASDFLGETNDIK